MTLQAQNVTYAVRGTTLVHDISIDVIPGQVTAILGPNGAGKSTLLKLLSGEIAPTSGHVMQGGRFVWEMSALQLAQQRAVMPQATSMTFPFVVRDVIALGRAPFRKQSSRRQDNDLVDQAISLADINHLADRAYPALSGGEKQRVHLARALVQLWGMDNPTEPVANHRGDRYLLLDEPTSGLDVSHQHALLSIARREARDRGAGVLMILHDFNQVTTYADQVAILHCGALVAFGAVSTVMTPAMLSEVFAHPIRAIADPAGGVVLVSQAPNQAV